MQGNQTSTAAIELRDVHRSFGAVRAVDGIDLRLELGEIAALLGPNGAGKTTTIDMILGLGRPDSGSVSVLDMSPSAAVSRGLVSAVMQTGGLLKDLTVRETLRLTASIFPVARPVEEVLERAGIVSIGDRLVGKWSGGEQQRLRFALALLPDPALMVLDEPTAGMDVEGRRDFWTAIRRDAEQGRTVLFATHYLDEADAYADRIILLRHGRIVADGTAAEVRNLSSGRSVRASLADADEGMLAGLPGVRAVEVRGDRVIIQTTDSDAVAKYPSGTKTRSCGPHVLVDEPTEEISPFDVEHTVGLFDGSETLGYLKPQPSMRASPVVVLHIDPKDAIEMAGAEDQQPIKALCAKRLYPALGEGVRVRRPDWRADHADPF